MNKLQLKIFRKKYQLTQKDLARIASVAVATVQSWENGYRNISQNTLKLLEQYEKFHPSKTSTKNNFGNARLPNKDGIQPFVVLINLHHSALYLGCAPVWGELPGMDYHLFDNIYSRSLVKSACKHVPHLAYV